MALFLYPLPSLSEPSSFTLRILNIYFRKLRNSVCCQTHQEFLVDYNSPPLSPHYFLSRLLKKHFLCAMLLLWRMWWSLRTLFCFLRPETSLLASCSQVLLRPFHLFPWCFVWVQLFLRPPFWMRNCPKFLPIISTTLWQLWTLYSAHGIDYISPILMNDIRKAIPRTVSLIERLLQINHE